MSAIFLSHSSADNEISAEVKAWLAEQGHRSVFLDFDPGAGIALAGIDAEDPFDWDGERESTQVPAHPHEAAGRATARRLGNRSAEISTQMRTC